MSLRASLDLRFCHFPAIDSRNDGNLMRRSVSGDVSGGVNGALYPAKSG